MARVRVFTELSPHEKGGLLAMIGRGIDETCKGLEVAPIQWALLANYDDHPVAASNLKENSELLDWITTLQQNIVHGDGSMRALCVPTRMTPKQSFLETMRRARGTAPVSPEELHCMVKSFMAGYLEAMVQWAGLKAARQVARDLKYLGEPGWQPGKDWHYWSYEPQVYAASGGA